MAYLRVKVDKIVYDEQPGFIYFTFKDIYYRQWTIVEKIPVLFSTYESLPDLADEGFYIPGRILSRNEDNIVFSTLEPYGICSDNGETIFVVSKDQVIVEPS